ncbi:PHR domain-containing protein [Ditylenchus destructor]|uniref:PHR domain-containing protein n=1 Tax=Ditylenchus destructor TaxID=166010 RepID=A0AAD4MX60_9BILA|nr:PHR domain-containing protein [Ditylenchus destructor]
MDLKSSNMVTGGFCGVMSHSAPESYHNTATDSVSAHFNPPSKDPECEMGPLTTRLNQFRMKGIGCDVLFLVGDEQERSLAHKLVLGCSSTVFNAMFYGGLSQRAQIRNSRQNENSLRAPENNKCTHDQNEAAQTPQKCQTKPQISCMNGGRQFGDIEDERKNGTNIMEETTPTAHKMVADQTTSEVSKSVINNTPLCPAQFGLPDDVEVIRVPDCSPTAFSIMIGYMYSDVKSVVLNDDNVMHTLYAAKKYDIHSLVSECVRYLLNGLSACNAVCLLAQARLFEENTLLQQCFEMIDKNSDIALQAGSVTDIDRDTLIEVLGRSQLDPSSELVIFHAAQAWAEAECERRQIAPTVDNLRVCLGPALQLIRFPLMNVNEFGQAASSSLLNCEEIAEVFLHLTVKPRPYCRYPSGFRCFSRSKHSINRFNSLSSKRCSRRENKICFTADRDLLISAIGIYGMAPVSKIAYVDDKPPVEWSCQVEIQLASVIDPSTYGSSVCHSATNNLFLHGIVGDPTPILAYFEEPVQCSAHTTYVASVRFISETGVQTFQGKDGQDSITVDLPYDEQVTFTFKSYKNAYGNDDGNKTEGQIPSLHFLVPWPENPESH